MLFIALIQEIELVPCKIILSFESFVSTVEPLLKANLCRFFLYPVMHAEHYVVYDIDYI